VFDPEFSDDDVIDRTTNVLPRVNLAVPTQCQHVVIKKGKR